MMNHCAILTLEEVVRIARVAARSGIKHIRLTGGEPLVRKGICDLIEQIKAIPGIESIALTTNGILLSKMAADLKRAGLDRVNISLDSLHEDQYRAITRRGNLNDALAGIDAALKSGFDPVKINVVVVRHLQQDLLEFARLTIDRPLHVRFIEYMPIGNTRNDLGDLPAIALDKDAAHAAQNDPNLIPWSKDDVVPVSEIKKLINEALEESGKEPLVTLSRRRCFRQYPIGAHRLGTRHLCQDQRSTGHFGLYLCNIESLLRSVQSTALDLRWQITALPVQRCRARHQGGPSCRRRSGCRACSTGSAPHQAEGSSS